MDNILNKNNLRVNILKQKGTVIWLTGLPGSGKTTLAEELEIRLLRMKKLVVVLDGDKIRNGLNSDLGYSDEDRNENIRRVTEVAAILKDASVITIVAFISPFIKMREFAKNRIGKDDFIEVFVKSSLENCISRDPKGLYKKAFNHEIPQFTGVTSGYEEPPNPDLVIDTDTLGVKESCDLLTSFVSNYVNRTE